MFTEILLRAGIVLNIHMQQLMWSQDTGNGFVSMPYVMKQEMKIQKDAASLRPQKGIWMTPKLGF